MSVNVEGLLKVCELAERKANTYKISDDHELEIKLPLVKLKIIGGWPFENKLTASIVMDEAIKEAIKREDTSLFTYSSSQDLITDETEIGIIPRSQSQEEHLYGGRTWVIPAYQVQKCLKCCHQTTVRVVIPNNCGGNELSLNISVFLHVSISKVELLGISKHFKAVASQPYHAPSMIEEMFFTQGTELQEIRCCPPLFQQCSLNYPGEEKVNNIINTALGLPPDKHLGQYVFLETDI